MTVQELHVGVIGRDEYLAARFRMAGHYPHVLALAAHAFRWAAKENSKDLMEYVLENGAPVDITALLQSAEVFCNAQALALLEAKRAATGPLHSFTNPLLAACFYGQLYNVVTLLSRVWWAKEVIRSKNHRGETALHKAADGRYCVGEDDGWKQRDELVAMLLFRGADPNQRDMNGKKAIISAEARNLYGAAMMRKLESPPVPKRTFFQDFQVEAIQTPADTTQPSSTDDEESSLKNEASSRDETGKGLAYLDGHKRPGYPRIPRYA